MKAGDKVRLTKDCTFLVEGQNGKLLTLAPGEELTIVGRHPMWSSAYIFRRSVEPQLYPLSAIFDGYFEKVACDGPHMCSCPSINFSWNGLGCQCGGV